MDYPSYYAVYRAYYDDKPYPEDEKGGTQLFTGAFRPEGKNYYNFVFLLATMENPRNPTTIGADKVERVGEKDFLLTWEIAPGIYGNVYLEDISWEEVAANPEKFGLDEETGKKITGLAEMVFYLVRQAIPDYYPDPDDSEGSAA